MLAALAAAATVAAIPFPTNIAFDPAGGMWVTSGSGVAAATDGVYYVPEGSHRARHVVSGLQTALGLHWHRGQLYVGFIRTPSSGRVEAFSGFDGRRFTRRRVVLGDLRVGRHTVDSIVSDPGRDRLLVGVGSLRDSSGPPGRILSFRPDGRDVRVEATGLRNPFGLAFIPGTTRLLVTDNARDDLGLFHPGDELDVFDVRGPAPHFGFPRCPPRCRGPLVKLAPHASADGLAVKRGPAGSTIAYVAEFGSSFARNRTGRDILRIVLRPKPGGGYRTKVTRLARFASNDPLGAAIGPRGRLYVTLFAGGRVVRYG